LKVLLPIIREKAEYLHAEGVSQTVWALSNAGVYDKDLWDILKKAILEKPFDYEYVKNSRWSAAFYIPQKGNEHFMQGELN
jgi:hypothetical protein